MAFLIPSLFRRKPQVILRQQTLRGAMSEVYVLRMSDRLLVHTDENGMAVVARLGDIIEPHRLENETTQVFGPFKTATRWRVYCYRSHVSVTIRGE